ncbi:MAG TPA: biotin--[acetyl-CoA-carboxylase] ligase [Candidatus Binatia bacterium]|nr:biotin--[acetyl-CoA-carboxylase] ligase [Candidatus Binatia bacterium]
MTPLDIDQIAKQLKAKRLGGKFHYFAELGSTNIHARMLAEQGAAEGEFVIAEAQTHGRGRLGRRWESPPGVNLYFSVILRPRFLPVHAPQTTLMAAVALAETIVPLIEQAPVIKWPNDILVNGRKLAGVLSEATCDSERIEFVILGIGLNLNYRAVSMPPEIRRRAISVVDLIGKPINRESVTVRLIQNLDRCYGELEDYGFEALRSRWNAFFGLRGRRIRIENHEQVVIGRALGIDRNGALIIEDDFGKLQNIYAGDVIPLES